MLKSAVKLCVASIMLVSVVSLEAEDRVQLPPSWTVTRPTYDVTVEELAKMYYGDANDYIYILEANKHILHGSHLVKKDTRIKIPITPKFRDQPERLGWNSPE
jgi:hypothetical protein